MTAHILHWKIAFWNCKIHSKVFKFCDQIQQPTLQFKSKKESSCTIFTP